MSRHDFEVLEDPAVVPAVVTEPLPSKVSVVAVAQVVLVAGARAVPGIATTAALGTVILLYAFIKLVYLPFPKGDGPFERVTLTLYRALGIF